MRESISNSYILMIVVVLMGLCATVLMSSLAFSKTFKIKNRIVEIIEKHHGYSETTESEIDELLKSSGYPTIKRNTKCPSGRGIDSDLVDPKMNGNTAINTIKDYKYCIYRYETVKGEQYAVAVYTIVEIPIVKVQVEFPVYGETKVFNDF